MFSEATLSEQEQDPNSVLTELDKGLRSNKAGEQCEAIVRFPRVFDKYPFPILINSACLKLAELFRMGTNFHRVLILRVMQQSQKHLDKILNIDEVAHRLYAVVYSNDPVARALTLRTLGSIASIVSEKKYIHHSIRNSLDSHDAVEMKAAIFASGKFAAQSKTFASNICGKIGEMIHGLATPVEVKLQLLSVFQHMHHDGQTIAQVWQLCTSLLPDYPSQQFVVCTFHTLTELAASCITLIPQQVDLLISYLKEDARSCVKVNALRNMKKLAKKGSHLWSINNAEELVDYALQTPYINLKCEVIEVLVALACSVAVDKFDLSGECKVLQLCQDCRFSDNDKLAAVSVELLTQIAIHVFQEDVVVQGMDLMLEVSSAIESLLLIICTADKMTEQYHKSLMTCFRCTVAICEVNPDMCMQYVDTLGSLVGKSSDSCVVPLCTALCSLGNKSVGALVCWQSELISKLQEFSSQINITPQSSKAVMMICTLLFQTCIDKPLQVHEINSMISAIDSVDLWSAYRIARQATRYGHYQFSARIFLELCDQVSSERFYFWLVSLHEISLAENCLQNKLSRNPQHIEECLSQAITHYMKAISSLKASTSLTNTLMFQSDYARLRSEVLQGYLQLLLACSCVKTSPPPAIAASVAAATRDELQKCGRVITQIRKCARDFRALADQYATLYQSVFDADPETLVNIQLLHQSCQLIAQAIDKVALHNQGKGFSTGDDEILTIEHPKQLLENYKMAEACRRASKMIRDFVVRQDDRIVEKREADHLLDISNEMFLIPLCIPRFFYQSLQSTRIKLAISPMTTGEPILIQNTSHLAIKVEGVVTHGSRPGLFRKVDKLLITVSSSNQNRTMLPETKPLQDNSGSSNLLSQYVTPHYDYFKAHFLLAFPSAGMHTVNVETAIVDDNDALWKTGPKMTLNVKSYDDNNNQKQIPRPSTSFVRF